MVTGVVARLGPLLLAIIIGRNLGPADYGTFTFATGIAMVAAQVGAMGWPTLMNRLVPQMRAEQDWDGLKGLRIAGDSFVISASLVVSVILFFASGLAGHLGPGFLLASVFVLPFALATLRRQQLATFRRPAAGLLFDQGFGALLTVGTILAFGFAGLTATALVFAAAILLGNCITSIFLHRLLPAEVAGAQRSFRIAAWMKIGSLLFVGSLSRFLISKVGELMTAPLAGLHESGLYGAAFRITFVVSFAQMVLMLVLTPLISETFAEKKLGRLRRLVASSFLFAFATYVPVAILLVAFPEAVLGFLFGEEFRPAAPVLSLLVLAQLATSLALPFQVMLTMGGKEERHGGLLVAALALQVALGFVLIPQHGAVGAATAMLVASIMVAILQVFFSIPFLKRRPAT
jgi:O-antigen/teichoic acid export membrane protein